MFRAVLVSEKSYENLVGIRQGSVLLHENPGQVNDYLRSLYSSRMRRIAASSLSLENRTTPSFVFARSNTNLDVHDVHEEFAAVIECSS